MNFESLKLYIPIVFATGDVICKSDIQIKYGKLILCQLKILRIIIGRNL